MALQRKYDVKRFLFPSTGVRRGLKAIRWCSHSSEHDLAVRSLAWAKRHGQMGPGRRHDLWTLGRWHLTTGWILPFLLVIHSYYSQDPEKGLNITLRISCAWVLNGEPCAHIWSRESFHMWLTQRWWAVQCGRAPGKKQQMAPTIDRDIVSTTSQYHHLQNLLGKSLLNTQILIILLWQYC